MGRYGQNLTDRQHQTDPVFILQTNFMIKLKQKHFVYPANIYECVCVSMCLYFYPCVGVNACASLKSIVAFYLWIYIRLNHISHTLLISQEFTDSLFSFHFNDILNVYLEKRKTSYFIREH